MTATIYAEFPICSLLCRPHGADPAADEPYHCGASATITTEKKANEAPL